MGLKKFDGGNDFTSGGKVVFNPVVDAEYTTLQENGQPIKMSAKKFQYDFNGNVTQTIEYDWFNPALVTRDPSSGVPIDVPNEATALRTTTSTYYNPATLPNSTDVYAKRTIATATPLILNALRDTINSSSQTRFSYDNQAWDLAPIIGNLTRISNWDDQSSRWLDTVHAFDSYGNRISTTAPKGVATTGDPNDFVTTFIWDPATRASITAISVNPLNGTGVQTTGFAYDYWTGKLTSQTDINGKVTTTDYTNQLLGTTDPFLRPGLVSSPAVSSVVGGVTHANQHQQTRMLYYDQERQVVTETDLNIGGDRKLKTRASGDQIGRTTLTESNEDGTSNWTISAQTVYFEMGRITLTSNPKRSAPANTDGWTRTTRDTLGRVTEVASFATAAQPPSSSTNANWTGSVNTSYYAEQTTVRDQANKQRRSFTDGLGRLAQVDELQEHPSTSVYATTKYKYDVLDNLRKVEQGAQERFFMYDSLSRLIRARNPEQIVRDAFDLLDLNTNNGQWTLKYTYDDNGNLATRTDARNVTTNYTYDGLNRNIGANYNDGITPVIQRFYDNPTSNTNGKGRLHYSVVYRAEGNLSRENNVYDALGRVTAHRQGFYPGADPWQYHATTYGYDLAGNLTTEGYPSGRTVTTTYDSAGRLSGLTSGTVSLSGMSYEAFGGLKSETYGNGLVHAMAYNSRLQPTEIKLGTSAVSDAIFKLSYFYGTVSDANNPNSSMQAAQNNGNLGRITYSIGGVLQYTQSYQYDVVNRLSYGVEHKSDASQAWRQRFAYSFWGSRGIDLSGTSANVHQGAATLQLGDFSDASNRITRAGYVYDNAGNLKEEPGGKTYSYDGENRLVTATVGGVTSNYWYDADGRRVKKVVGSASTSFVYNAAGLLIAEYTSTAPGIGGIKYVTADHLGSTRLVTSGGSGMVKARYDYLPFGEELGTNIGARTTSLGYSPQVDPLRQKFGSKERDTEIGLDYFLARYHSPVQGRLTSVDPENAGAYPGNPQSWNGYTYALNNPIIYSDPDGLKVVICYQGGCVEISDDEANATLFNKKFQERSQFYVKQGNIYDLQGNIIGTYENICCDSLPGRNSAILHETARQTANPLTWGIVVLNGPSTYVRFTTGRSRIIGPERQLNTRLPQHAERTLEHIERTGTAPSGYRGGRVFRNDGRGGGEVLPRVDSKGNLITYREWDVNPHQPGVNRGAERLVTGSDGSAYYTNDHYNTFIKIK